MPELPEVETIRRELARAVANKTIAEVIVNRAAVIRQPSVEQFRKGVEGAAIKKVMRQAKVLICALSTGTFLTVHLKMTGQLVYPGTGERSRVSFRFTDATLLDFNDARVFGELRLLDDWRELPFIKGLGPEPSAITAQRFKELVASKRALIKPLLMDQSFLSGIGNLYAAEALFHGRIHPQRRASSLSDTEKDALFRAITAVLHEATRAGGSSVDDYVRLSGKPGGYSRFHTVYGREGMPCTVCKTPIRRITLGGRGTYFCPKCQRMR